MPDPSRSFQPPSSGAPSSGASARAIPGPLRLSIIEGDGIGREVIPAAVELLQATGLDLELHHAPAGWACFQAQGTALPEATLAPARRSDAILFGAVSSPSHRVPGYHSPIVALRRELDLFANLRPSHAWPLSTSRQNVDLLIVRENSEGLYVRRERRDDETAIAERVITRGGSARIARVACEWAMRRRRHLTIVHKANVLPETCGLFRRTALEVAAEFPELTVEERLVDAMALQLVTQPERFDVIVTTNLFGDILSDEAAGLVGGLGLAPSANLGATRSPALFEPVHGSAPDIAGQGIANPIAAFLAVAMLLEHIGERAGAAGVRAAVAHVIRHGPHTPDLGGAAGTSQVTAMVKSLYQPITKES